jgi:hypothetical protein
MGRVFASRVGAALGVQEAVARMIPDPPVLVRIRAAVERRGSCPDVEVLAPLVRDHN